MPNISLSAALADRMDYLVARQGVIAGNIANADTPGYLAKDLTFQSALNNAANPVQQTVTNSQHMVGGAQAGAGQRAVSSARFMQHNGNAVRLDQEMLKMQDTQLNYRMMTQLYAKQVALQKTALGTK